MVRFAEWFALESLMEQVGRDVLLESVVSESLEAVFDYLERGLGGRLTEADDNGEEEDDGPAVLDDPFTGDEDAAPVAGTEEEPEASDEEDARGQSGGKEEKYLKAILDSLVAIRNQAKRERAERVEKIADLKKELEGGDADDLDSKSPLDALPDLVELGYLGKERAEKIRRYMVHPGKPKNRVAAEKELNEKISEAAAETGNEHNLSMMSADKAMERLSNAMFRVFKGRFGSMARRNMVRISSTRTGHVDYEPEELASETIIYLLRRFKKRNWKGGKLLPWEDNDEILRSGSLEHLKKYIFRSIRSTSSRLRSKKNRAMNPTSKSMMKNAETSIALKARVIRSDLEKDNMEFYLRYIEEASKRPLRGRPENEEVLFASGEDKVRLAIMKDMEYKVTWTRLPATEISMDPKMIRRSLRAYMDMFLRERVQPVTYASTLAGDEESSSDEVLSGAAFTHSKESDDEFDPRGINPMDSGVENDHDDPVPSGIGNLIKSTIEKIAKSGNQGPSEAMALCLKLGIRFSFTAEDDGRGRMLPKSLVVTDTSRMHTGNAAAGTTDCAGNVLKIGLSFGQIREGWPKGLWQPSLQSVGEYLRGNQRSKGAVQKFCDLF